MAEYNEQAAMPQVQPAQQSENREPIKVSLDIEDRGGFLWGLVGFFAPILGILLYLLMKRSFPRNAKACAIGVIVDISVVVALILVYILFVAFMVMPL